MFNLKVNILKNTFKATVSQKLWVKSFCERTLKPAPAKMSRLRNTDGNLVVYSEKWAEKKKDRRTSVTERHQIRADEELRARIIKENSTELDSIRVAICYNTTSRTITGYINR